MSDRYYLNRIGAKTLPWADHCLDDATCYSCHREKPGSTNSTECCSAAACDASDPSFPGFRIVMTFACFFFFFQVRFRQNRIFLIPAVFCRWYPPERFVVLSNACECIFPHSRGDDCLSLYTRRTTAPDLVR
jgi:hypothetical protein